MSVHDDVVVGDQPVRGDMDQDAAIGPVRHQPVVKDATHRAPYAARSRARDVLLGDEAEGPQTGQGRGGAVPEDRCVRRE